MKDLIKACKALSDETRLRILYLLFERECCVCEVMQALEISQTRASRNLSMLHDAGFLTLRKEAVWSLYSIEKERMADYLNLLAEATVTKLGTSDQTRKDIQRLRTAERVGPECAERSCLKNNRLQII